MSNNKDLAMQKDIEKIVSKDRKVIDPNVFMAKRTAPFSIAIDKAINDDKQLQLGISDNNEYMQNAIVQYNKKSMYKVQILFKNFFKDMSVGEFEKFKQANSLIRDSGPYNIFAKKIKHIFESKLFDQYESNGNIPLTITDEELANILGKPKSYINANMPNVLDSLSNIQIEQFSYKGKAKVSSFTKVNLIQLVNHSKGKSTLMFNDLYAYYLREWGFTQYPKELLKTNDKNYQLAFDIGSYICEMKYQDRDKIKIRSVYERVTKIPRYEDVKDKSRAYQKLIYTPFDNNIEYLNSLNLFHIKYENTDYFDEKDNINFEKWLDTNLIVTWNIEPNYTNKELGKEKARKLAERNKRKKANKETTNE